MSENYTQLYLKHNEPCICQQIPPLFSIGDCSHEAFDRQFVDMAVAMNESDGEELAKALLTDVEHSCFQYEEQYLNRGWQVLSFVHGSNVEEVVCAMMLFLSKLAPGLDVRAHIIGDQDPWEMFMRVENGSVRSWEHQPFKNAGEDTTALESGCYVWWHDGLPEGVGVGLLQQGTE